MGSAAINHPNFINHDSGPFDVPLLGSILSYWVYLILSTLGGGLCVLLVLLCFTSPIFFPSKIPLVSLETAVETDVQGSDPRFSSNKSCYIPWNETPVGRQFADGEYRISQGIIAIWYTILLQGEGRGPTQIMFVGLGTFYAVRYIYDEQCLLHLVIYVQQPNAIINQRYQLYTPLNYHCPVCLGTKNPPCPLPAVWPGPGTMCPASGGVTWRGRTSRPWFGLAGLNDVPNISKPWDFLKPWDGTFLNSIVFGENMAWILFFWQPLAVFFPSCGCEPGWAISEASPCDHWADLHRKGPTKGSNKTDPIRSYQHLDDKTLANISHCNVLFPAETKAHVANFISLLAPPETSICSYFRGRSCDICLCWDSWPIPLASGVEALHHWTHCDRVLFSCVACRKRHGIWGCRVWRAQPLMFADGHASALILTWQGFICQELLDVCGIKNSNIIPH